MRRSLLGLLVLGLCTFSGAADAQPMPPDMPPGMPPAMEPGMPPGPPPNMPFPPGFQPGKDQGRHGPKAGAHDPHQRFAGFFAFLDQLEISNEQLLQLRGVFQKHKKLVSELSKELKDNKRTLAEFMRTGTDRELGQKLAQHQGELFGKLILAKVDLKAELQKILTLEQRGKLSEMAAKKRQKAKKMQMRGPAGHPGMDFFRRFLRERGHQPPKPHQP